MTVHIRGFAKRPLLKRIGDVPMNISVEDFFVEIHERKEHNMSVVFWIGTRQYEQLKKRKLIRRLEAKDREVHLLRSGRHRIGTASMYLIQLTQKGKRTYAQWVALMALLGVLT